MRVSFKELHNEGKTPSIWGEGQMFIRDLNRTQAFQNVVPGSFISWGFISLPIPKQPCSEPCLRFFPQAWLLLVPLEGPSYLCTSRAQDR